VTNAFVIATVLILAPIHCIKARSPHLTATWISGERYAAYQHAWYSELDNIEIVGKKHRSYFFNRCTAHRDVIKALHLPTDTLYIILKKTTKMYIKI